MNRPFSGARFQAGPQINGGRGRGHGIAPSGRGAPPLRGGPPPGRFLAPGREPPIMMAGVRPQMGPPGRGPSPHIAAGRSQIGPGRAYPSQSMMGHQGRHPPPPPPPVMRGRGHPPPPPPPPRRSSAPPHRMPMNHHQPPRVEPPFIPGRGSHLGRAIPPPHPPQQQPSHIQQHRPVFPQHPQPQIRNSEIPHPPPQQRNVQHVIHNTHLPVAPPRIAAQSQTFPSVAPPVDPRQMHRRNSAPVPFDNIASTADTTRIAQATAAATTSARIYVNASAYSKEKIDQAWIEHTPVDGSTKYYYNTITKTSQYDKPEPLKLKDVASAVVAAPPAANQSWIEYTDASSGKKYYSNGVTTTWEKPESFNVGESQQSAEEELSEPPRKKKRAAKKGTEFGSKEESVAAFKGLLLAKEITPSMKWNDVVKLCSSDPRWEACEEVLTVGERKQSLAEYQTKRANDLRAIERQEKARAKEAFMQLLTDSLPSVSGFSAWTSRFEDVRDALTRDDRFHAVATEATRESLFLDFCEEYKKREERKKRNKKKEAKDAFIAFLAEKEEEGSLSFASTWNSFLSSLSNDEKADSRFATSSHLTDSDRQLYFADFVIELQTAEDDKRSRIRGARRRAEKAQREAYEEALQKLAVDGKIVPSSRWRAVEEIVTALPSHGPVYDQNREAPREIFEDFVADWNEAYRRDRSFLSELVYAKTNKQIVVTADTSYEEFTKALLEAAADSHDMYSNSRRIINRSEPVSSARLYWRELVLDAKGLNGTILSRRGIASRRGRDSDSSSEDEGEIVEDGAMEA